MAAQSPFQPNGYSLLTTAQAGEILGYRESTLVGWRHQDRGPAYIRVHGTVRYTLADLEAWIDSRTVRPKG